jgi:translation elongation factor EF-1alpha
VVLVDQMWSDDEEVTAVGPGENVKIKLKGIEEDDVSPGFVLCDNANPIKTGRVFDAQVNKVTFFAKQFLSSVLLPYGDEQCVMLTF